MSWLKKVYQQSDDPALERAKQYFGIGHGDFNEDLGYEPTYIVWLYSGGRVLQSEESYWDEVAGEQSYTGSHQMIWGSELTDSSYRGRFEPETGRISIVRPAGTEKEPVPHRVLRALHNTFDIKETSVF